MITVLYGKTCKLSLAKLGDKKTVVFYVIPEPGGGNYCKSCDYVEYVGGHGVKGATRAGGAQLSAYFGNYPDMGNTSTGTNAIVI